MNGKFLSEHVFQPPINIVENSQHYKILEIGFAFQMPTIKVLREDGEEAYWSLQTMELETVSQIKTPYPEYFI